MQSIIGNLLPNTSDIAPIKGQHKNWRNENSDPMKPAKYNSMLHNHIFNHLVEKEEQ